MKLRTFRASTMAGALTAVKSDLGAGAVILHTRTTKSGGLFGFGARSIVEVIASDDAAASAPRVRTSAPQPRPRAVHDASRSRPAAHPESAPPKPHAAALSAYTVASRLATPVSAAQIERDPLTPDAGFIPAGARFGTPRPSRGEAFRPEPTHATPRRSPARVLIAEPSAHAPAPAPAQVLSVRKRTLSAASGSEPAPSYAATALAAVAAENRSAASSQSALATDLALVKSMVAQVLQGATPAAGSMPDALFKLYLRLLESQVARDIADKIIGAVRDELTGVQLADEPTVRATLLRHLAAYIPVAPDTTDAFLARTHDHRPFTLALVGPTGVGKTTTIAKLAATYRLRHGKKIGLITCDTYRIAAVEQLRTYANIINVPLKVVMTPQEMAPACEAFADCDIILIDTAGRSQNDSARLAELKEYLAQARPHQTHLVLSSAASEAVLLRTAEQFALVAPDRAILTKLDEAVNFGVLINIAARIAPSISFITTGQEVPDHLEPSRPERIARLVLEGSIA
ncbi:MAG: hypothetical protein H7Y88_01165 [Phycisphaerales bacterium]|nr:hypothetical protein [Phycisphaerales bacterium]